MSYQKVILLGNVGKDPEIRKTNGGDAVANFILATSEKYTSNGQKVEKTEWHDIVCFRKSAEIVEKYVKKGRTVLVEGKIRTEKYTSRNGEAKYTTRIYADNITLVSDGKKHEEEEYTDDMP